MRYYKIYYHVPELKKSETLFSLVVEAKNEKHAYMRFRNSIREREWQWGPDGKEITRVVDKIVEY